MIVISAVYAFLMLKVNIYITTGVYGWYHNFCTKRLKRQTMRVPVSSNF